VKDKRIAIIGAGISGLASAIRCARMGNVVDLYEKNDKPGGKLSELRLGDYRFDTGPSLFTLPHLLENLFSFCEEPAERYFTCQKLETTCRYFWQDGTVITAYNDPVRFAQEVELNTGEPKHNITRFLNHSRDLYDLTNQVFIFNAFPDLNVILSQNIFKFLSKGRKMEPFTSMHQSNLKRFQEDRIIQLFDRYATYNGSNPYTAPATLNVIAHLEHNLGAYFPEKGMFQIGIALKSLADRVGVRFFFNAPVQSIVLDGKKVKGIVCSDQEVGYDVVVSAIDVHTLYSKLLPRKMAPERLWESERSSSAVIFYWGIRGSFPGLDLHNILFSGDYKEEFEHIFNKKTVYGDPTVYIFISSKKVQDDAPPGCENWFVMVNAPANYGQDWDAHLQQIRTAVLQKIRKMLNRDVEPLIEAEQIADPRTIEGKTASAFGSIYGISSNDPFAAFYRHPNKRKQIRGLYFAGGSVHPGGGIPLCLASAEIVAGMISKSKTY